MFSFSNKLLKHAEYVKPCCNCQLILIKYGLKSFNIRFFIMIIQLYEIQTPEEAGTLIDIGVDHIGSVVVSPQQNQDRKLRQTVRMISGSGSKSSMIPLFSEFDAICRMLDFYRPDILHLCEMLTDHTGISRDCEQYVELQTMIKDKYPSISIMRSIPIIRSGVDLHVPSLELAEKFAPVSDYFLTDTLLSDMMNAQPGEQPVQGFVGITGLTSDWAVARELVAFSDVPVILAGGLSPDNVEDAILSVGPAGVDSCTGTNRVDEHGNPVRFKKDIEKVKRFVRKARAAAHLLNNG